MNTTAYATPNSRTLPVRVCPIGLMESDAMESFMSWASRLAWSNGYRSIQRLLGAEGFPAASISSDVGQEECRRRLVQLAGFDDSLLASLTVRIFPASPNDIQRGAGPGSRWILHRDTTEPGTPHQVCPQCLAAGEVPYWKMNSRRSYVTQCAKHGAVLLSHCPECGGQLTISRTRTAELHQCAICRFDLRCAEDSTLSPADQVPQHWTNFDAATPHPCAPGFIEKHAFWAGVKVILDVVCRPAIAMRLLKVSAIESFHGPIEKVVARPYWSFDHHDVGCRHHLLLFIKWLLEDWDNRVNGIQSMVDIRSAIKYSRTNYATWPQEYFRAHSWAAYIPLEVRYARSLVNSA